MDRYKASEILFTRTTSIWFLSECYKVCYFNVSDSTIGAV